MGSASEGYSNQEGFLGLSFSFLQAISVRSWLPLGEFLSMLAMHVLIKGRPDAVGDVTAGPVRSIQCHERKVGFGVEAPGLYAGSAPPCALGPFSSPLSLL